MPGSGRDSTAVERLRVVIGGAVQGVGFRPFVYQLAARLSLSGWVCNDSQGVQLEVEGAPEALRSFLTRLSTEKPPHTMITSLEPCFLDPAGYQEFEIRDVLRLLGGTLSSGQPPVSLPVHELHALRPALQHH